MKNFIFITTFLIVLVITSVSVKAQTSKKVFITVGADATFLLNNKLNSGIVEHASTDGTLLLEVKESELPTISEMMHDKFNRCGGFVFHENYSDAVKFLNPNLHKSISFADYSLNQSELVEGMVSQVKESNLRSTITKLSSFKNRYYKGATGVKSQKWLKSEWERILTGRSDAEVTLYKHSAWDQPSVIAKITGSKTPDEVIILGGHADSIAGYFGGARARAPGADDNASGMATLTEVMRIMVSSSYRPEKTIYFMAYAAEEVGLRGSKAIASDFKNKGVNVVGALQLDMTNFDGSKGTIALMSDYTNADQNAFIGKIIDTYVPEIKWSYSKCGYACSDHASWTANGYPASFPFEAQMGDMNHNIHTSRDTISRSNGTADHASLFSKITLGFMVELDR